MNIDNYLEQCKKTAIYPNMGDNFDYVLFGLLGECGEVANIWKKNIRDGSGKMTPEISEKLKSEFSDIFWYLAMCCSEIGVQPSDILQYNIEKLKSRMERGVIGGSGDNR